MSTFNNHSHRLLFYCRRRWSNRCGTIHTSVTNSSSDLLQRQFAFGPHGPAPSQHLFLFPDSLSGSGKHPGFAKCQSLIHFFVSCDGKTPILVGSKTGVYLDAFSSLPFGTRQAAT